MNLNVGDRVWHVNAGIDGGLGTVLRLRMGSLSDVQWDQGTPMYAVFNNRSGVGLGHSNFCLKSIDPPMLEYDPMQQGDTDDDI